ncbi:hypothetical protein Poli38472_001071 [Pythium oligandrum]|uniref:Microsomal glutathione S-transferase 1 n=1 Tax=Pythium oligandrum TaxID=41045 RepID=A0A8K1CUI3_PYTOL|nr:hypothetical protein Poli38472_001071 [Pythium oligandrum]|eukprot:TMW68915.1 hypothetical protein Poli38472_001071 [Pythium oligandrum]
MVASLHVRVYTACAAVLYAKFLVVLVLQSNASFDSDSRPPEDIVLGGAKGKPVPNYGLNADEKDGMVLKAREVEHRWRRIVANDLESIPFALLVFAGSVLAQTNEAVFATTMITYTIARCLHSYTYAKQMQPIRANVWFLSTFMILVAMIQAVVAAFF